ncbi:MAG TPA: beta-ketoacyl synthase chain length factor [Kofleriaceae bacterium]
MTPGTTVGPIQIRKTAFFSTCHASAQDVLAGRERPFTAPAYGLLVGRARRFTSLVTQMHVEVCGALQPEAHRAPAVFATCHGEIQTCERLIADFRDTSMVSSARFALSVHNTASGVYSVATDSTAPTTTVTGANAIAAGWLEAVLIALDAERPVLLSIADEPVPAVFRGPTEPVGFAAAFLVGAAPAPADSGCTAELAVAACPDGPEGDLTIDPLRTLARLAEAWAQRAHVTIALGPIQPGAMLELRVWPPGPPAPGEVRA